MSCLGSFPHRDVTEGVHSVRLRTGNRYVPPSGFRILSAACSTFRFAGLFHPAATSRVSSPVQGFLPPRRDDGSSPPTCPLAVVHRALTDRLLRASGCHARSPRLRGFAPRCGAFLGGLFRPAFGRSPLRFLLLQVSIQIVSPVQGPSALGLLRESHHNRRRCRCRYRSLPRRVSSVLSVWTAVCPSPEPPACSRSWA
jgi:hypothetical protein